MTETDKAFLKRMAGDNSPLGSVRAGDVVRLLALARRGAAVPDEPFQCPRCDGTGIKVDYVRFEMKCVMVDCSFCNGTGVAMLAAALKDADNG